MREKNSNTKSVLFSWFQKYILYPVAALHAPGNVFFNLLLLLILAIPFYLYKLLVILLSKCLIPGSTIMANLDNIMAHGTVYRQKGLYIPLQLNYEGRIDYEGFVDLWEKNVMQNKRPDGSPKFPELQYYIKTWMGYSFYRVDKSFSLKNHIKLYENPEPNSIVDRVKIDKIRMEFVSKLFEPKRSPWEILIVNNYRLLDEEDGKECSVIILKIHHCLADGYATLLLFWEAFAGQQLGALNKPKAAALSKSFFKRQKIIFSAIYHMFAFMYRQPFYFIYDQDKLYQKTDWHNNKHKSNMVEGTLRPLESSVIKELSKQYDVSITAILTAVVTGGFRRMMAAKGLTAPKSIRTSFSLPLQNHPPRLTTHSFITDFEIPICDMEDKERLKLLDKNMKNNIRGSLLVGAPVAKLLLFGLPLSFKNLTVDIRCSDSMSLSTVPLPPPTPSTGAELLGCRLIQVYNTCELSFLQNISISVFFLKYKDQFFQLFGIQRYLISDDKEVYDIEKYIEEEIHYLRGSAIV